MTLYLITGGAGFIGSHIAEVLRERGEVVRVLDDFSTGKRSNLQHLSGVEVIEGDVRDVQTVRQAMTGAQYVIHLAALVSVTQSMIDPATTYAINVDGTLNILTSARDLKIQRVVLASSCAVYGDNDDLPLREISQTKPLSPYAASKLIGEITCETYQRAYGVPIVGLRYFNIYGPRQDPNGEYAAAIPKLAQRLKNQQAPIIYGDGTQTRDFVHVSDVVRANLIACTCDAAIGQVFNIATGRGVSLLQLVDELNDALGTSLAPEFQAPRSGDIKHSRGDGSKAAQLLQFAPAISLREGLKTVVNPSAVSIH
jgi:nucleoside-diphosphate-sugar epimerase